MAAVLPPKTPGEHRWVALCSFTLTSGQASAAAAGSMVKLGPHNMVTQSLGCIDCEAEWPAKGRCSASAAPEMDNVTGPALPLDDPGQQQRLLAATDLIGRTGATGLEIGFVGDEHGPVHLARWYAQAHYRGRRAVSEEHASPVDAAEALAWSLLEGGQCRHCGKTILIEGHAYPDVDTREACWWRRMDDCWVPTCVRDVEAYVRERRAKRPRM